MTEIVNLDQIMADIVAADSISQCQAREEIFQALKAGMIKKENLV